jgi:hypothetical protein
LGNIEKKHAGTPFVFPPAENLERSETGHQQTLTLGSRFFMAAVLKLD